jgi:hypothetical protein
MAAAQEDTFRIVIEGIVNQNTGTQNAAYNAAVTFVNTTLAGQTGCVVLSAKYHSTLYPKLGETTIVPAGLGNN